MRLPDLIGVFVALVLGVAALGYVLQTSFGPVAAPTPTSPTMPPISLPTEEPGSPAPTDAGASPSPTPAASPTAGLGLGMRAPTLTLPALGGGTIDTAAYAGTPLWVTFMATWCPSCIDELPMMDGLQARLGDDLAIVLVDVREDEELVASFINSLDVELPVALDRDGAVQAEWGYVLPTHYFIDADGILREVIFGGAPPPVFLDAVRLVAPEADLPVETLEPAGG